MTATRAVLPNRRSNVTTEALWQDHQITVTVGLDDAGNPAEVFAGTRRGGAMATSLADAATIISIALQHGIPPDAPASPVGTIMEVLMEVVPASHDQA